jgi:hypothetical protein
MKKKINKSNLTDSIYIFMVRAGIVFAFIGTILVLFFSTITQSGEILNYAKYILPSILILIGFYSMLFGVSERPMRTLFSSRTIVRDQAIKLFSGKYPDILEYGLIARITGFVCVIIGVILLTIILYV